MCIGTVDKDSLDITARGTGWKVYLPRSDGWGTLYAHGVYQGGQWYQARMDAAGVEVPAPEKKPLCMQPWATAWPLDPACAALGFYLMEDKREARCYLRNQPWGRAVLVPVEWAGQLQTRKAAMYDPTALDSRRIIKVTKVLYLRILRRSDQ